jgi:exopolyphosphatase/guanosine-5'-triphosphate,3'-diphosphate pyrophosphatase
MTGPVAALDVGTQSVRLLISDGDRQLHRQAVVTHLGKGVRASRAFDPASLSATLEALGGFRRQLDRHGVQRARAVATEVVRLADDPGAFLGPAAAVLGMALEPLTGDEEGRLAFAGATAGLDPAGGPFVTVDLGGGSCEFAVGRDRCEGVFSAAFGASVLSEAHIASDPPRAEELSTALSILQTHLDEVIRMMPAVLDAVTFIGLGGTFTTMAAVEIGLDPYDPDVVHGFDLQRDAAEDVFRTLVTERRRDRLHNPGLPAARVDTIVGGSCAVVAIMRFLSLDAIRISEHDLLDGIVQQLLA